MSAVAKRNLNNLALQFSKHSGERGEAEERGRLVEEQGVSGCYVLCCVPCAVPCGVLCCLPCLAVLCRAVFYLVVCDRDVSWRSYILCRIDANFQGVYVSSWLHLIHYFPIYLLSHCLVSYFTCFSTFIYMYTYIYLFTGLQSPNFLLFLFPFFHFLCSLHGLLSRRM